MTIDEILAPILRVQRPLALEDAVGLLPHWDSARHVDVILAVEEAAGVDLTAAEIERLRSIRDIVNLLREHGVEVEVRR
jgi:acyl carrier protein